MICDFDGTVSTVDIGNRVLNRFTENKWQDIDRGYITGEVGSREAYAKGAPLFRGGREEVLDYCLETERIDPYFVDFYRFCRDQGIDLIIASDGFDFYIEAVLSKYNLTEIAFFSNHAEFHENGSLSFSFPAMNDDCGKCGACKNTVLQRHRAVYDRIIYVGDGHSDVCPSQKADLVFAKRVLYEKCLENQTACIPYENFRDVRQYLMDHFDIEGEPATKK
ncbi:MAG: MtnX-like HAD-IB family phosphatase [Deltaproteobacteria bacterium]|nr:MtnX-like HAD-IB family phosphatase [Deltaproteobacteria bacterium]